MRANNTPPSTPLACVMTPLGRWKYIIPTMISKTLNNDDKFCGPNQGFESKDVSNQLICATCAMALLCSGINIDTINIIGRWRRNDMICYLHAQLETITINLSKLIIIHGNYSFLPQKEAHYSSSSFIIQPFHWLFFPLLWTLVYGDSDNPLGSILDTNRENQNRK